MRDKSSTFLLCCPGYIALRTPLGTPSPDKDTWDAMADEVPCELWQPLSIALTGGHMGIWNNKALWSTFSQVGCNNLKKWETDGGNGRSWEKITSAQTSPREEVCQTQRKHRRWEEAPYVERKSKSQNLERGVKSILNIKYSLLWEPNEINIQDIYLGFRSQLLSKKSGTIPWWGGN